MRIETMKQLADVKGPNSRAEAAAELKDLHEEMLEGFRDLQRAIGGYELPFSSTFVRICLHKEGSRKIEAQLYGFPAADAEAEPPTVATLATRFPHQAESFAVYYGRTYGQPGYDAKEEFGASPQFMDSLASGQADWEETSRFHGMLIESASTLEMLRSAAQDAELNPEISERVRDYYAALESAAQGEQPLML